MCQEARATETKPGNGGTEILKKPLDKRHKMCYNEYVKGKQTTPPPRLEVNPKGGEENLKKLEKPLDFWDLLC